MAAAIFYTGAVIWAGLEILVSRRNERRLSGLSAIEHGKDIYLGLSVLYPATIIAGPLECYLRGGSLIYIVAGVFLAAKILKVWVIRTLKGRWVVKVYTWEGQQIRRDGPYRYLRHPNYLVMAIEIPAYCLAGGAWFSALVVTPLYALLLLRRVSLENSLLYSGARP